MVEESDTVVGSHSNLLVRLIRCLNGIIFNSAEVGDLLMNCTLVPFRCKGIFGTSGILIDNGLSRSKGLSQ